MSINQKACDEAIPHELSYDVPVPDELFVKELGSAYHTGDVDSARRRAQFMAEITTIVTYLQNKA